MTKAASQQCSVEPSEDATHGIARVVESSVMKLLPLLTEQLAQLELRLIKEIRIPQEEGARSAGIQAADKPERQATESPGRHAHHGVDSVTVSEYQAFAGSFAIADIAGVLEDTGGSNPDTSQEKLLASASATSSRESSPRPRKELDIAGFNGLADRTHNDEKRNRHFGSTLRIGPPPYSNNRCSTNSARNSYISARSWLGGRRGSFGTSSVRSSDVLGSSDTITSQPFPSPSTYTTSRRPSKTSLTSSLSKKFQFVCESGSGSVSFRCMSLETLERLNNDMFIQRRQQSKDKADFEIEDRAPHHSGANPPARNDGKMAAILSERVCESAKAFNGSFGNEGDHTCVADKPCPDGKSRISTLLQTLTSFAKRRSCRVMAAEDLEPVAPRIQPPTRCSTDTGCTKDGSIHMGKMNSLQDMREKRQDQLIDSVTTKNGYLNTISYLPDEHHTHLWLYASGVVAYRPSRVGIGFFSARCGLINRLFVSALIVATMAFHIYLIIVSQRDGTQEQDQEILSAVLALEVGCILRLILLCVSNDQVVGHAEAVLTCCVSISGVDDLWEKQAGRDVKKLLLFWLCMVGTCVYTSIDWYVGNAYCVVHVAVLAFVTNIFLAIAYHMLYTCRGLFLVLDDFCSRIVEAGSCDNAVDEWNTLLAIIRRACTPVARSFILLLTSSLVSMFVPTIFAYRLVALLPGAFSLLVVLWVSYYLGVVTSKCDRVPAFINTLDFGESFDAKRQYVVAYINNSRAGFYMFDVRVTGEMVVKCSYVGSVLAVFFLSREWSRA